MKLRFGMPLDPSHYAWELVKRLGFKEPSIDWVDIVLEHLGLRRESYSGALFFPSSQEPKIAPGREQQMKLLDNEPDCPAPARRRRRPTDAFIMRGEKIVVVDTDFPLERQRLATCHEIGHFCLPWHEGLTYYKDGCYVEPPGMEQGEIEASRFGADLLMPPPFFREDMDSLSFGLKSVERLSRKYLTSLEATARHYVGLSSKPCALVVVEALPKGVTPLNSSWLKVRYGTWSSSFDHFIRPGTEIAMDSPVARASLIGAGPTVPGARPNITEEVPGWVLGLRPERRVIAHCSPWGKDGDVLVLVEERQGNQGRFF